MQTDYILEPNAELQAIRDNWTKINAFNKGSGVHQPPKDNLKKKKAKRRMVKQSKKRM